MLARKCFPCETKIGETTDKEILEFRKWQNKKNE